VFASCDVEDLVVCRVVIDELLSVKFDAPVRWRRVVCSIVEIHQLLIVCDRSELACALQR